MTEQQSFEEQYYDILRAMELKIYELYTSNPYLLDYSVEKALNGTIRTLNNQQRGKAAPKLRFKEDEQAVYRALQSIITLYTGQDDVIKPEQILTIDEMINCVKRIQRSQNQMGGQGRQGYLDFLKQFFGE